MIDDLEKLFKKNNSLLLRDCNKSLDNLYAQIESLSWLQMSLKIKGSLPPLRGWPVSPDFLLRLHTWIKTNKPNVIVETGSGASTIVIADALRQNGFGRLYSFEHLSKYASQTKDMLANEFLTSWVDFRLGELVPWTQKHLNLANAEKPSKWYPLTLHDIEQIDLLIVDGPPEGTCRYARYPALPALFDRLAPYAEIWMDDANRQDEQEICKSWADDYGFSLEFHALEKGLGVLKRH